MTVEIRFTTCHGPGCRQQAVGDFCSELCATVWNRALAIGNQTPAEYALEWRHPYEGEIHEACCRLHYDKVRGALNTLGIGHAGMFADVEPCVRCLHEGKKTRDWISTVVVHGRGPGTVTDTPD